MSFMRDVISIVSENEALNARDNIIRCIEHINGLQHKVRAYIDDEYTEYLPDLVGNNVYLLEASKLCEEADQLLQRFSNDTKTDLLAANDDLHGLVDELREVNLAICTSRRILRINELFGQLNEAKQNRQYVDVMALADELGQLLDDPGDAILPRLDCYAGIRLRYDVETCELMHSLRQQLDALVQLTERKFQKTKAVTVRISRDENQLHETLVALMTAARSPFDARPMCDFLLANVFEPIVRQPVALQLTEDDPAHVTMTLSFGLAGCADDVDLRPAYRTVFANVQQAFTCLGYMNITLSPDVCVFGVFAVEMRERFMRLLIDECLMRSVPSTMDEMNGSTLVEDVLDLHQFLCDMLFLPDGHDSELVAFAGRVDTLFRCRFCTNIVDSAVAIMRHDLHDMEPVGDEASGGGERLPFARCMVSSSTVQLISLMDKVVQQRTSTKAELAASLLATIPTIVDRYLTEVPLYHERMLHTIPQQTALFHNNCQYLAHWLTLNARRAAAPKPAGDQKPTDDGQPGDDGQPDAASVVCWTTPLRQCGSAQLGKQVGRQREQLLQLLAEFDVSKSQSQLDPHLLKIVRQCLRQLELLQNVWQSILASDVYDRTMGSVLNEMCAELVRRVMQLDDVPAAVCGGLVELFDHVAERAPGYFADRVQVQLVCRTWPKMLQLRMMLDASMAHIVEQWADGKGPLTLHYRAEEVKHLIRALFQNTDRRANALAKIV